jgi:hypothetical protein
VIVRRGGRTVNAAILAPGTAVHVQPHWIVSTVARSRTGLLLWVLGATRDACGNERVDPSSAFGFPLAGRYQGNSIVLSSPNARLQFSFGAVPLQRFELRGAIGTGLSVRPGAALFAQTVCAKVPNYGPELTFTGICNPGGVLAASATFISGAYRGPAATRPKGVGVGAIAIVRPTAADPRLPAARRVSARPGAALSRRRGKRGAAGRRP